MQSSSAQKVICESGKRVFQNEQRRQFTERPTPKPKQTRGVTLPPSAQFLCEAQMKKLGESILDMELPRIPTGMAILERVLQSIQIILKNSRQKITLNCGISLKGKKMLKSK